MKSQKDGVHSPQLALRRQWHSFTLRFLLRTSCVAQNFCSKWSVLIVMTTESSLAGSLLKKSHFFLHRRANCLWKHQGISNHEMANPSTKIRGHCFLFRAQHAMDLN